MKGFFISMEGGEGCGKSSQIRPLRDYFIEQGFDVVITRDPGGDYFASKIRELLLNPEHDTVAQDTELLLYLAARAQIANTVINPAIEKGKIVLCDRFYHSTLVYQSMVKKAIPESDLRTIMALVPSLNVIPDLTLVLDIDATTGLKRSKKRLSDGKIAEDKFENLPIEFHEKVNQCFRELYFSNSKVLLVDASGTEDEVGLKILDKLLNNHDWRQWEGINKVKSLEFP